MIREEKESQLGIWRIGTCKKEQVGEKISQRARHQQDYCYLYNAILAQLDRTPTTP